MQWSDEDGVIQPVRNIGRGKLLGEDVPAALNLPDPAHPETPCLQRATMSQQTALPLPASRWRVASTFSQVADWSLRPKPSTGWEAMLQRRFRGRQLSAAKERPSFNPLISHVASADDAFEPGTATPIAAELAKAFWPGPMTLIPTRRPDCPIALDKRRSGQDHPASQRMPRQDSYLKHSAGRCGAMRQSFRTYQPDACRTCAVGLGGRIELVLDGGPVKAGLNRRHRLIEAAHIPWPGGVTRDAVAATLAAQGLTLLPRCPRQTRTHPQAPDSLPAIFAPSAPVRLNVTAEQGMEPIGSAKPVEPRTRPQSAPERRPGSRRQSVRDDACVDATGAAVIGVAPVPGNELGEAINDRLRWRPRRAQSDFAETAAVRMLPSACPWLSRHSLRSPFRGDPCFVRRYYRRSRHCWCRPGNRRCRHRILSDRLAWTISRPVAGCCDA